MYNYRMKVEKFKVSDGPDIRFSSSKEVAESKFIKDLYEYDSDKERFYVLLLNIKNTITGFSMISQGSMTESSVHPREVLKAAILGSAYSIIFVHNHPSGDSEPSQDDIGITTRLQKACSIMGIGVLDHIILGLDAGEVKNYYSFNQHKIL